MIYNTSVVKGVPMKCSAPFNTLIPKDLEENLKWRATAIQSVLHNQGNANFFREACSKDPLFFFNGFCWTFDPRNELHAKLPFILYPFQEEALIGIIDAIGSHDLLLEKSRDMGASWICIGAFSWCFNYIPGFSGLFVSRVEDYVDKPGNPKCMFWKFDYLMSNLPSWLRPIGYNADMHRSKLHVENPDNGAVIDGESTTGNVARGDRRTAIMLDEFAAVEQGHRVLSSTRDATNCRLFNSTPAGTSNAFYDIRQTGIRRLRLHWSAHPLKSRGLYKTGDRGELKVVDSGNFPLDYNPKLDNKLRSPWYDKECERAINDQEIAQELDIDYLGSGFQYFDARLVERAISQFAKPPMLIGELEYDDTNGDPIRFVEGIGGSLQLWCTLDGDGKPIGIKKCSAGTDVSAGTGASNSCISGYDITTCEKVWEYANSHIRPEQFAKQAVAICKLFGSAYLIWESYGPGRQFGAKLKDLNYGNIYMRKRDEAISSKVSDVPGWCPTPEGKLVLMGDYRDAISHGQCINRSRVALEETLEYIHTPDGSIEHSRALSKVDPSGAKKNHGDRVIADALAWKILKERTHTPVVEKQEVPVGCLKWRNDRREELAHAIERDGW